jgi:hypothetical protein
MNGDRAVLSEHNERLGVTVSVAVQDPKVLAPRPNGVAVLVGKNARELVQVCHVVHRPRCQELGQCHDAEGGMATVQVEMAFLEV